MFDNAPLASLSMDGKGKILLVNRAWSRLLGYGQDEATGRLFSELIAPEQRDRFDRRLEEFGATGRVDAAEFDLLRADGLVVPVRLDGSVDADDPREGARIHYILTDLRSELSSRRALAESESKYRRLVELAREGIWQIDREAYTVFVNPSMARILGYTEAEMLGRHLSEFLEEESWERCLPALDRELVDSGQHEAIFITKDGRRIEATLMVAPIFDDDGNYAGGLAGVMDISEQRRYQMRMLHNQKMESLGVMAGGIAHDFNNLLQVIAGNASLVRMEVDSETAAGRSLSEIESASRRASLLCHQMLSFAGKTSHSTGDVDLGALVGDMKELLRAAISKKVDLVFDIDADMPTVSADATQLRQVIMNLASNASEALEGSPGTVTITVTSHDGTDQRIVRMIVEDTGCGMDEDVQHRIFDPFFTTKFSGRGLGLAAVLGVVQSHHGSIDVDSRPDEGTRVVIDLPALEGAASDTASETETPATKQTSQPRRGRSTVIIADDELSVLTLGRRMLERLGYRAVTADNGEEALVAFQQHRAELALVILDLTMPVLDGREALQRIRELDPDVPVVICSGYTEETAQCDFGEHKPDGFLQKPYRLSSLRGILEQLAG